MRRRVLRLTVCAVCLCACGKLRAEVAGHPDLTGNTDPNPVLGWYNVGSLNGASGVYLGNGWVLTVAHLGTPTQITLDGSTYYADSSPAIRLNDPSDPTNPSDAADLQLFHIASAPSYLPILNIASTSPTAGTHFTAVGFGDAGVSPVYYNQSWVMLPASEAADAYYGGFSEGDRYTEHWAMNQTVNIGKNGFANPSGVPLAYVNVGAGNTIDFFSQFYSNLSDYNANPLVSESEIGGGDSGGAVFDQFGNLIGINEGVMGLDGQPDETAIFGDMSAYVDLAAYREEILSDIPEPASVGILATCAVIGFMRRTRHTPSPGTPGEGRGEGDFEHQPHRNSKSPSP